MNTIGVATPIIDIEDAQFTSGNEQPQQFAIPQLSPAISKLVQAWLCLTLIFMPIAFGGVHPSVYLPIEMITSLVALAVIFFGYQTFSKAFLNRAEHRLSNLSLLTLLGLLTYCVIQYWALAYLTSAHPVLGTSGKIFDKFAFTDSFQSLVFFTLTVIIVRSWLGSNLHRAHALRATSCIVGFGVSMIALSHWFYDNGKLFWTFAGDYVNISTRARWPFVNPNHLGHFLLPIAFIALGYIQRQFSILAEKAQTAQGLKDRGVTRIMTNQSFQRQLIWLIFSCLGLFAILITMAATLSRGTWLGCSVGLVILALSTKSKRSHHHSSNKEKQVHHRHHSEFNDADNSEGHRRRRRRRRDDDGRKASSLNVDKLVELLISFARPAIALLALALFIFFLYGRGTELLSERIEYGLMYSKDDLRWQMYADTLPMIAQHPLFGVGLGGWLQAYGAYANSALSGLNPVYLHCDPIQFLSEVGILGVLPVLLLGFAVVRAGIRKTATAPTEVAKRLKYRLCGLIGLLSASFLDFPFRIPAILLMFAVLFALTLFDIELPDRAQVQNEAV